MSYKWKAILLFFVYLYWRGTICSCLCKCVRFTRLRAQYNKL